MTALDRARQGLPVRFEDKLADCASLQELQWFVTSWREHNGQLTTEQMRAVRDHENSFGRKQKWRSPQ